jgi:hypothetical protein
VLILRCPSPVVTQGDRCEVTLTVVDREPTPPGDQVAVTVLDPAGREIASGRDTIPPGSGIKELGTILVVTGVATGEYRVIARLLDDGDPLATTTESILALPPVDLSAAPTGIAWLGSAPPTGIDIAATGTPRVVVAADPAALTGADWAALFAAVEAGANGVIGPLRPGASAAADALAARGYPVELHFGIGNWLGCYHWQPESALFAGLPAGGLAGEVYADVLPRYVFSELGGTVLAGSLYNSESRKDVPRFRWFSGVESVEHGRGRLIFCQYRVFDRPADSLANRMLANLLSLAADSDGGRR